MNGRPFIVERQNLLKHVLDQALHFPFVLPPLSPPRHQAPSELPERNSMLVKVILKSRLGTLLRRQHYSFNLMNVEDIVDSMDVEESVDYMNI